MIVIQVATEDGNLTTLYLEAEWELTKLNQLIQEQLNIPISNQKLFLDGNPIAESCKLISDVNLKNGDVLLVRRNYANLLQPSSVNTTAIDETLREKAKEILENYKVDSLATESIKLQNKELYDAICSKSIDKVVKVLENEYRSNEKKELEHRQRLLKAYIDPLNPESQSVIQEEIERQRINENYISAQNYLPESFGNIVMLYINVEINNVKVKALVDTGAQHTIMHKTCAQRCDLLKLIDDRFKGIAVGVGSTKTLGKIHLANMKINSIFIPVSFIVLDYGHVDFILGLDILRRYTCNIDLKNNHLVINDVVVPFLSEKEIKDGSAVSSGVSVRGGLNVVETERKSNESHVSTSVSNDKVRRLCELLNITPEYAQELLNIANGDEELAASFVLPNN